jgi:bilin biosynthesis protein
MKMKKWMTTGFACLLLLLPLAESQGQPKIPKDKIPGNLSPEARQQVERLYSQDPIDRGSAAFNLRKLGDKAIPAIPFLIANLDDQGISCKDPACDHSHHVTPGEEAEKTLIHFSAHALQPLMDSVADKNLEIRRRVVRILGLIKDPRAVNPLISALSDENRNVRMMASWSLIEIGDPAVDALVEVLKEKTSRARGDAAWALGKIKSTSAVPTLVAALNEADPVLQKDAAEALKRITGQDYGTDVKSWEKWWEQHKGS